MLTFEEDTDGVRRRTKIWTVGSRGEELGLIKWYSHWRRYVFQPWDDMIFDFECLTEIGLFLDAQTKVRKAERAQEVREQG